MSLGATRRRALKKLCNNLLDNRDKLRQITAVGSWLDHLSHYLQRFSHSVRDGQSGQVSHSTLDATRVVSWCSRGRSDSRSRMMLRASPVTLLRGELTVVLLEIEKKDLGGRRFEGSVSATACGRGHEVPPKLFHFLRQSHVSFAAA
jgi:hypothetical protein